MSELLRRLRIAAVPHGFRSSFRDWAAEETDHPREVAEAALAHVVKNKVEAAYRRTDLFERRRRLMDDWADYLSTGWRESILTRQAGRSVDPPCVERQLEGLREAIVRRYAAGNRDSGAIFENARKNKPAIWPVLDW